MKTTTRLMLIVYIHLLRVIMNILYDIVPFCTKWGNRICGNIVKIRVRLQNYKQT